MRRAILSVWDKTGLIDLAARLDAAGWKIIASGGTAGALVNGGIPVTPVSLLTGEPEMLAGRVKTLHPAIHAPILARDTAVDRAALAERGWPPIDLVVVNLYPFEKVIANPGTNLEEAIEHIDIGGVTLLRAAAKNHDRVAVLSDQADYPDDLRVLDRADFRRRMAYKAFSHSARYDAAIGYYLARLGGAPAPLHLNLHPVQELRYGENPHQEAVLYSDRPGGTPLDGRLLQGKPLSYNNLLDLDAAWRAACAFDDPAVVVVKHGSPSGLASAPRLEQAVAPAVACDPVSAFGSVIACNREVNAASVGALGDLFVECLVAPAFSSQALEALSIRSNLRMLEAPLCEAGGYELRSIVGGFLRQTTDTGAPAGAPPWQAVSRRQPTERERVCLHFAWKACQFVKSNAIVLASEQGGVFSTVGIGGGQPNRLDCVSIAGQRASTRSQGAVLASDAFFPFPDGVEAAAALGVTAIVQPGGARRDQEVIAAANDAGLALIFTGVRHLRH